MSNILLALPSLLRLSMAKHGAQSYTTGEVSPLTPLTRRDAFPGPDGLPELRASASGPTSAPISAYVATLGALWTLGAEGPDADRAEIRRLLGEVARQCDELGAEVALAVSRHAAREWAHREHHCPTCGDLGVCHDPETGEERPLGLAPGPRDISGWLVRLHSLGGRRPCPLTPCARCGDGTFAIYGDTPLCRRCSDAWGSA